MREELVQLFRRVKITTINVTHDQDEAMMMSDRVMVLREGYVQQVGVPTELYMEPENVFVASFIGQANFFYGQRLAETSSDNAERISLATPSGDTNILPSAATIFAGCVSPNVRGSLDGQVLLMCRPDNIRVYSEPPADTLPNILPGTIVYTSFVAGRWRTMIRVPGQPEEILTYPAFGPYIEQPVWLELPPRDCRVLPVGKPMANSLTNYSGFQDN